MLEQARLASLSAVASKENAQMKVRAVEVGANRSLLEASGAMRAADEHHDDDDDAS